MKKKLFLGALLLGALTLNSCVDNVESDSVKSVRQAKAEQLKAKADLDKATGEAALITANAEKAVQETLAEYQKAQAEYEKARAEYEKAQAAYWNAKAESEQAAAAQAAEQAAIDLEKAKLQLANYEKMIASLEAKWEEQLYKNQEAALKAKIELEKAIKKGDQAKIDELETLLTNYTTASKALITAQKDLADKKMKLAKYEAGLMSSNQLTVAQLNSYYGKKIEKQIEIDGYEAALQVLEKEYNYEDAKEALDQARKELGDLKIVSGNKEVAWNNSKVLANNAEFKLKDSQYKVAVDNIIDYSDNYDIVNSIYGEVFAGITDVLVVNVTNPSLGTENVGNYCAKITSNSGDTYIPLFSNSGKAEDKYLTFEIYDNSTPQHADYLYYNEYYNLVAGGMDKFVTALKAYVKDNQEQALTDATKDVTDQTAIVNPIKALCDKLEPLMKAYNDAVKAKADAPATTTDFTALDQAITTAKDNFKAAVKDQKLNAPHYFITNNPEDLEVYYNTQISSSSDVAASMTATVNLCKRAYNKEKDELDILVGVQNTAEFTLKAAQKTVAAIEADAKTLNAGNEGNLAAIKTVNETQLAQANAHIAYYEAQNDESVKQAEMDALNNLVEHEYDFGNYVSLKYKEIKDELDKATLDLAEIEYQIDIREKQLASGELGEQKAIEELKLEIADLEVQIPVLEQKVKLAKELLDAAMKSEDAETPAE